MNYQKAKKIFYNFGVVYTLLIPGLGMMGQASPFFVVLSYLWFPVFALTLLLYCSDWVNNFSEAFIQNIDTPKKSKLRIILEGLVIIFLFMYIAQFI